MGPPLASRVLLTGRMLAVPNANRTIAYGQTRNAGWLSKIFGGGAKEKESTKKERKSLTELLEEKKAEKQKNAPKMSEAMPQAGGLSESSIFGQAPSAEAEKQAAMLTKEAAEKATLAFRDPKRASWNWIKKHEWRQHVRRGRLTKEQIIMRTEKVHTVQSHLLKTSMKKLAPLARQIAGKKLEDAMAQMEFSAKGPAKEVLEHLKEARNEAIVRKRMDPTQMYVSQAWVNKGIYGFDTRRRARGRIHVLRLPHTSITVELKEEATRQRIAREKEEKAARKPVWYQLPSKRVHGQQQYYQW